MSATSGVSTVEVLVALVVFAVGALGAASTLAFSVRAVGAGSHAATAARLGATAFTLVAEGAARGAGSCAALPAPRLIGGGGEEVEVRLAPHGAGRDVSVILRFTGVTGPRVDTARSFLRCR